MFSDLPIILIEKNILCKLNFKTDQFGFKFQSKADIIGFFPYQYMFKLEFSFKVLFRKDFSLNSDFQIDLPVGLSKSKLNPECPVGFGTFLSLLRSLKSYSHLEGGRSWRCKLSTKNAT